MAQIVVDWKATVLGVDGRNDVDVGLDHRGHQEDGQFEEGDERDDRKCAESDECDHGQDFEENSFCILEVVSRSRDFVSSKFLRT